jgi:hypothetical protein
LHSRGDFTRREFFPLAGNVRKGGGARARGKVCFEMSETNLGQGNLTVRNRLAQCETSVGTRTSACTETFTQSVVCVSKHV